ncbi:molecular chaperone GrpE [Murinocardiopsis flavida]|uniref:Protein GrpE n=1 Tax=Murinocardiopsis flavida TaxID=645275 RepID=A0A2P8DQL6_9ACTN|nr:nucleotide exchange factor GrpE [Murinocardiopsis flavida]PSK99519.1 molecular chaperone GrpE [Murinocardiopsis flavida]
MPENENGESKEGPVIRDKRRVDPETGELRQDAQAAPEAAAEDAGGPGAAADPDTGELAEALTQLNERTSDLKRLQAEYANYRKRVDRDRVAVREQAVGQVLSELLPVLDDIGRAREHGELNGGFKSVGESLEAVVTKLGLKRYADKGDLFDPNVHEALTMMPTPGVEASTVIEVFQPGYQIGERVIRPARVVVSAPADDDPAEDVAAGAEDVADAPAGEPGPAEGAADTAPPASEAAEPRAAEPPGPAEQDR